MMGRALLDGPEATDDWGGGLHVYTLADPRTAEIRYVGVTYSPRTRWLMHVSNARSKARRGPVSPLHRWILELNQLGLRPTMTQVQRLATSDRKRGERVEAKWIDRMGRQGARLFNVVRCGGGHVARLTSGDSTRKVRTRSAKRQPPSV